jgi:hypothetical protein
MISHPRLSKAVTSGRTPNKGMQATGNSLRSYLAPALSRAWCLAFGLQKNRVCNEKIKRL